MTLSPEDASLFVRLHMGLLACASRKLNVKPVTKSAEAFRTVLIDDQVTIRDALMANPTLIDDFVAENPEDLSPEDLQLAAGWRRAVVGDFYVMRHLKRYSVFVSETTPNRAYGVCGINHGIDLTLQQPLPVRVKAVLVPWRNRIVYDGLLLSYPIYFGAGMRRALDEDYRRAKAAFGVIETLARSGEPPPPPPRRATPTGPTGEQLAAVLDRIDQELAGLKSPVQPAHRQALAVVRKAIEVARVGLTDRPYVEDLARGDRLLKSALNRLYRDLGLS